MPIRAASKAEREREARELQAQCQLHKTDGQLAYEADCQKEPTYKDGTPRKPWSELPEYARHSWERNPTPR